MAKRDGQFVAVVLAGGFGTRLWPLSREDKPKQFLPLAGNRSLFQQTIDRLLGPSRPTGFAKVVVVGAEGHAGLIASQCDHQALAFDLLFEPFGKNTAPAIAAAVAHVIDSNPNATIAVLAADHHISDSEAFLADLALASEAAQKGTIVTFGIKPDHPNTGYGYIRFNLEDGKIARILGFEEKPDAATAQSYLDAGDCFWNSGMFVFRADAIAEQFNKHAPEIWQAAKMAVEKAVPVAGGLLLEAAAFGACQSLPFDKAIMEHTDKGAVVRANFPWSDLGAWPAIHAVADRDGFGNAVFEDDWMIDASNILHRGGTRKLAAIGVRDLVIVETPDVLLVADASRSQDLRKFVEKARAEEPFLARKSDDRHATAALARRNIARASKLLEGSDHLRPATMEKQATVPGLDAGVLPDEHVPAGSPRALVNANRLLDLHHKTGITAMRQQAKEIAGRFLQNGFDREEWQPLDWPNSSISEGRLGWAALLAELAEEQPDFGEVSRRLITAALSGELFASTPKTPSLVALSLLATALCHLRSHGSKLLEETVEQLLDLAGQSPDERTMANLACYLQTRPQ